MSCPRLQHNDPAWFRTQTSWSKSSALLIWKWIFHKKRVGRLSVIEIVNGTYSAKDETHPQCTSHFSYSLHKVTAKNLISGGTNIPVLFQSWPLQVSFLYLFWMFPNPFLVLEVSIVWSTQQTQMKRVYKSNLCRRALSLKSTTKTIKQKARFWRDLTLDFHKKLVGGY